MCLGFCYPGTPNSEFIPACVIHVKVEYPNFFSMEMKFKVFLIIWGPFNYSEDMVYVIYSVVPFFLIELKLESFSNEEKKR